MNPENLARQLLSIYKLQHPAPKDDPPIPDSKICLGCGKSRAAFNLNEKQDMSRCSQCKLSYYCSKSCQIIAWKNGHKDHCKELTSLQLPHQLPPVVQVW